MIDKRKIEDAIHVMSAKKNNMRAFVLMIADDNGYLDIISDCTGDDYEAMLLGQLEECESAREAFRRVCAKIILGQKEIRREQNNEEVKE